MRIKENKNIYNREKVSTSILTRQIVYIALSYGNV